MNIHKNARLTPLRREEMALSVIEGSLSKAHAARTYGVSPKIVARWVERYKTEGRKGMVDRSSRPTVMPGLTSQAVAKRIVVLRRQRRTGKHIAMEVNVSPATVSRVLRRSGLSRLRDIAPAEPIRRYEREHPGEMIHIDIKKLGRFERVGHRITGDRTGQSNSRGVGWEFVHVCIDDASRVAFTQILPDERKESAIAFLKAAVAYYATLGISVARVMTDNGSCYRSKAFARTCRELGLKHIRTKPYTPMTNGKAERFIQTAPREWAYAIAYPTSDHRAGELPIWLHRYNWHRPHGSLKSKTPISRLGLTEDNLLRLHIYVCTSDSDAVQVYDPQNDKRLHDLPSGRDPEQFAVSADGKRLFVANEDDAVTTVINLATRQVEKQIDVGIEPEGIAASPDGKWVITTSETTNMAHFIDTAKLEVVENVLVGQRPRFAVFSADSQRLWVSSEIGGTVSVIDVASKKVTQTIEFAIKGVAADLIQPVGMKLSRDGTRLYVALGPANHVAVVETASGTVLTTLLVGRRVWHLDATPEDDLIFATNGVSGDVSVIDTKALKVIKTIKVGRYPWGVAVKPKP